MEKFKKILKKLLKSVDLFLQMLYNTYVNNKKEVYKYK